MYANTELPSYQARQRMIARMLHKDAKDERWVTLKNGVHICLDLNDNITKGPDELKGKNIKELKETKYVPQATSYYDSDTDSHLDHMRELGYRNRRDYENAAVEFFNSDKGKLMYGEARERFYRYDERSQLLAVCDKYGIVRTFFKVNKKGFERIAKWEKVR